MKKIAAAFAAIALIWSTTAFAGIVMEENETINAGPDHPSQSHTRTVMVEGKKEKVDLGNHTLVVDLDKGVMTMVNPGDKSYVETAFPPQGPMSQMIKAFAEQNLNYKKTGKTRTIAGYKCEEYTSSGKNATGEFSTTACYSTDAPGAAEYSAFQSAVAKKLGGDAAKAAGTMPHGVPLAIHTSRKVTSFTMPGMPPEQAKMLSEMMAKRPPIVSDSQVTRIASKSLSADTFAVPSGYTKHDMPMRFGPGGTGAAGKSGMPMGHPMVPAAPLANPPASVNPPSGGESK